jgi:plasmid stability protein
MRSRRDDGDQRQHPDSSSASRIGSSLRRKCLAVPTAGTRAAERTLMYNYGMAVMTVSEARAALPDVLDRVAKGEEVTITRHGRPVAVVMRPDVIWQSGPALVLDDTDALVTALRDRARRHGRSLEQELRSILEAAKTGESAGVLPPVQLHTVRIGANSTWPREEIYDDEGR